MCSVIAKKENKYTLFYSILSVPRLLYFVLYGKRGQTIIAA